MPLWGKTDTTANSCIYAPQQVNKAPTSTERDALYGNTTVDAYGTGRTVGQFGVSVAEMSSAGYVESITVTAAGTGYTARPTITVGAPDLANGVQATATSVGKLVAAVVGNVRGSGYVPGNTLTVAGGTGTAATANVTNTEVNTLVIGAVAGTGYANGDTVTVVSGTGTAATATVTTGAADTIPASLAIATRGNYTANPTLNEAATTTSGSGTGLTVDLTMGVKTVAILTAGAYTALPTLNENLATGGAGTAVTLDLTIGAGAATITNAGSGYSAAPDITFGGAGGTGSAATATVKTETSGIAHPGWVLRTEGSGGRANRVHYETLVAMGTLTGDASDDAVVPE